MIPLNVTHTAIATKTVNAQILGGGKPSSSAGSPSKLRHALSTLVGYFADAYEATFGFIDGPPVHDALTVAYVSRPALFNLVRHRVDIELTGTHSMGETVVDIWNYRSCDDSWGPDGKNCMVAQQVEVGRSRRSCCVTLNSGNRYQRFSICFRNASRLVIRYHLLMTDVSSTLINATCVLVLVYFRLAGKIGQWHQHSLVCFTNASHLVIRVSY